MVSERNDRAVCPDCGKSGHKVMTAPAVHCILGYYDENLANQHSGEPFYVSSPAAREKRQKELGLTSDSKKSDRAKEVISHNRRKPISVSG